MTISTLMARDPLVWRRSREARFYSLELQAERRESAAVCTVTLPTRKANSGVTIRRLTGSFAMLSIPNAE